MVVKCAECGVSCDNCQLLLRHHRYHHGEKIRCEYCSYVVSRNVLYRMKDHYRRRHAGKEFQQVGQEKTSLSKARNQRSPSWRGLKYGADNIMEATQSSRVYAPERFPLASTPATHLRSPSLTYLGEFPTSPAKVSVVPPAMRNIFKTPVKMLPVGIETHSPFTVTSSGERDALTKPSSGKPLSLYETSSDPGKLYNMPPYNPTPMESSQQPHKPPKRVELLRPVPTYLVKHINVDMPKQGAVYEYTNRLSSLHYADPSEAFAGDPNICSKLFQAKCLRQIRMKAMSFGQLSNSHHSDLVTHEWLKRVEKAILPNETVNMLTSMWFPDTTVSKMESRCTMTEDDRPLIRHIETQTEESSLSTTRSARSTDDKETQCSIFSLNMN